jgi:hypothetical protein
MLSNELCDELMSVPTGSGVRRRRQFCALCGQLMFEYFSSADGHFGLVDSLASSDKGGDRHKINCPACGSQYCLLERLNSMGAPVERE